MWDIFTKNCMLNRFYYKNLAIKEGKYEDIFDAITWNVQHNNQHHRHCICISIPSLSHWSALHCISHIDHGIFHRAKKETPVDWKKISFIHGTFWMFNYLFTFFPDNWFGNFDLLVRSTEQIIDSQPYVWLFNVAIVANAYKRSDFSS